MSKDEYPVFEEHDIDLEDELEFGEDTEFGEAEFVDNPEPRCPCVLLLDTSASMKGKPIKELNEGLKAFKDELMADELAAKRVEVAVVGFGPVEVHSDFQTPDTFTAPTLVAEGETPMGEAIERAIEMVHERKETYKSNGINYYRPWIFLITDGAPTDPWENACKEVQHGEQEGSLSFFPVAVEDANMDVLAKIGSRQPLKLDGLRFRDLFAWLSRSLQKVSQSRVGSQVELPIPSDWTAV